MFRIQLFLPLCLVVLVLGCTTTPFREFRGTAFNLAEDRSIVTETGIVVDAGQRKPTRGQPYLRFRFPAGGHLVLYYPSASPQTIEGPIVRKIVVSEHKPNFSGAEAWLFRARAADSIERFAMEKMPDFPGAFKLYGDVHVVKWRSEADYHVRGMN